MACDQIWGGFRKLKALVIFVFFFGGACHYRDKQYAGLLLEIHMYENTTRRLYGFLGFRGL